MTNMDTRVHLEINTRWRAIGRIEAGHSQLQVANWLKVSPSVISRLWNRFQTTGDVAEKPRKGHPRVTTPSQDRYIKILARRNRRITARAIVNQIKTSSGTVISVQTVRNRLHKVGMYSRRPIICVPLSLAHRAKRREWCQEHQLWDNQQFFLWTFFRSPGSRYVEEHYLHVETRNG